MSNYELTNKAVADLNEIWEYTIENWSEEQADRYYDVLLENCEYLAKNPNLGRNYEGIKPDLLGMKVEKHLIFYRVRADQPIEITRILHAQMDLKNRMN